MIKVLLVEDDRSQRELFRRVLEERYEVFAASSVAEARRAPSVDLVVTDFGLPDGTGQDVMNERPLTLGLVISGSERPPGWSIAWLRKPFTPNTLLETVARVAWGGRLR